MGRGWHDPRARQDRSRAAIALEMLAGRNWRMRAMFATKFSARVRGGRTPGSPVGSFVISTTQLASLFGVSVAGERGGFCEISRRAARRDLAHAIYQSFWRLGAGGEGRIFCKFAPHVTL
jgi:hypothetical protein